MAPPAASPKQWMLGLPGHNEVMRFEEVLVLVKGGQLRPTDLVKKLGEPWRAANEMPELLEYFTEPRRFAPMREAAKKEEDPTPPPPPAPAKAPPPAPTARTLRPMTARMPVTAPPPAEKKPAPATTKPAVTSRVEAAKSETKPPEALKTETKEETKPPDVSKEETKPPPVEEKPKLRDRRTRPVPKPAAPPEPVLEPMVGKYLGPVDMLRCASFAFDPKKLLLSAAGVAPLGVLSGLLWALSGERENPREWAMAILAAVLWIFGFAFIWTALAYVTRRQLEGQEYSLPEVFHFAKSNIVLSAVYPAIAIAPTLFSVAVLYGFKWVRNNGSGGASFLRIAYFLPMAFAFLAMAGALLYQLASLYVPAAAAIEGQRVTRSVNGAWNLVRRQWGRVVLHWLIITVAVGVISFVTLGLAACAIALPEWIFGRPESGSKIADAWNNFRRLVTIYEGIAFGLGLTLPVSLFSTLGTLSYVSLRHPASAQLSPSPLEETSGIAISPSGTRAESTNPAEATQPGETRPAPPDATPVSGITDDSDEQPLVKD
jgi:hypothetical protein